MSDNDNYFKDIEKTIKNYLAEKNTDYGIMLTGEWGAGKTYYVKNYLGYVEEESKFNKPLYISVAGKSNVEEVINDLFLLKILGNSSNNKLNIIKTIANNGGKALLETLKFFKFNFISSILPSIFNIGKNISKEKLSFENVLVILDDLERLSKKINIEDLLYSIYDNFISNNVKVLFICNEKVLISNNEEYNKIKEKIIRYTIKLHTINEYNFKLFLEKYIIKNLIDEQYIENYYINNDFFYKQCIPNIIFIFMEMECYNIRTFKKFFDMSKYFLNEINNFIYKEEYKLNNNEELFLEILRNFAFVLISYDKNIYTDILSNFDSVNSKKVPKKTNDEDSKIKTNVPDMSSKIKELNLRYNNSMFYFYRYLECGLLDFEQIYLIYKDNIYLNKNVVKSYSIVSRGYESYDIIKENINIIFKEMKNNKDDFGIKFCWDIYKIVYIDYGNLFNDIKKDYFDILKNTLKYHWSITDIKTIYHTKIGYENNNFFFYPAFEVKINIKKCDSNYNLKEYEKELLDCLYNEKVKEIPDEFNEVLENFKCHNKDYFTADFYFNSKILYLLFIPQNLKLIPRDVFSVRILLNFLYLDITIRNSFQEYKIYDYNATKVKDMVNNLKPFIDSIETKDEYLLIRIAELKERIKFYNNTDY